MVNHKIPFTISYLLIQGGTHHGKPEHCTDRCGGDRHEHIERIQNRIRGAKTLQYATYSGGGQRRALRSPAPAPQDLHRLQRSNQRIRRKRSCRYFTPGQFHCRSGSSTRRQAGILRRSRYNTAADGKEIVEAGDGRRKHSRVAHAPLRPRSSVKELIDSGVFGAPMVIKAILPCRRRC